LAISNEINIERMNETLSDDKTLKWKEIKKKKKRR